MNSEAIRDEKEIVWLEDIEGKDYVRQMLTEQRSRSRPIKYQGNGRSIGYSTIKPEAESYETGVPGYKTFYRRIFYLTEWDRDGQPDGTYKNSCPGEAVDPRTIKAGVVGVQTDRVKGLDRT